MSGEAEMIGLGRRARAAARILVQCSEDQKNRALLNMATALEAGTEEIMIANGDDLSAADAKGITGALRDRLALTAERIQGMAHGLREVAELPDPVGAVLDTWVRPNGLQISQVRIPLGVIGIIYEARPNVTADAAGLCLKSGNVVFLRGGSEARHSNGAILKVLRQAVSDAGLPADAVMSLPSTDRSWIMEMLKAEEYIDVIIPRGGESLIRFVTENSRVPVIKHYKGVCHVYVDVDADLDSAKAICVNAKVTRPGRGYVPPGTDSIQEYAWDINGNGTFDDAGIDVTGANPTVAWAVIEANMDGPADRETGLPSNTVTLRVTDGFGATHTATTQVARYDARPSAVVTQTPNPAAIGQRTGIANVTLDGRESFSPVPGNTIDGYEWVFNPDNPPVAGQNVVADSTDAVDNFQIVFAHV